MMSKPLRLTLTCFIIVCTFTVPAFAISVSCTSGVGGQAATTRESFNLDDSTSLKENLLLGSGSISLDRQAEGTGNNSLKHSLSGNGYTLQNNINSRGDLRVSTSSAASTEAASLSQSVGGVGNLNLNLRGAEKGTDAGQEASVAFGAISSQQSLSAGQGVFASQSTELEGLGGKVVAGALGRDNVVVAKGSFDGLGILTANLDSATLDGASARGTAALDGVTLLSDDSFKAISSNGENQGMGMAGLRMAEGGVGNFDMSVLNMDLKAESGEANAPQNAAATAGGSYSSYGLTGFRWNQRDPKVQLYLNPTDTPSGLTAESSQNAISAAANTWDDAVGQNIFADGSTVKIDYSKAVPNPFSSSMQNDAYSVNGWKNFGNSYLGVNCYWSNGQKVDGYYSLTEADTVYNLDYKWTDNWNTAVNTGKMDLQSVAVHELGHGIGMDDLYTLPDSDPRKNDFAQVMNSYDGPQRTLGNGDLAGAVKLYGVPEWIWKSTGDGYFDVGSISFPLGYDSRVGSWVSGDITGDGKSDLIHVVGNNYLDIWKSTGDGKFNLVQFSPWSTYNTGAGSWVCSDVTGDGKSDLIHITGGNYIHPWTSKGDGSFDYGYFSPWSTYNTGAGSWVCSDVTGDGKSDLIHITGGNYIHPWTSKGDGSFDYGYFSPWSTYNTGTGSWVSGDITGDGKSDLIQL